LAREHCATLSTHVLDAVLGSPAIGLTVRLLSGEEQVAVARTGPDGRIPDLAAGLEPGVYRLVFETGGYFATAGHLFQRVSLDVVLTEPRHYHVPLLLGPFSVTSYRGT
jgi:5-hydroxyisourate hydrolase